ncbi:hypothetical protein BN1723_012511 [Verticillium longisporum]|uniref:Uncharacterized protein n=1 Tax=Verticillium longisporum TaxID=100787 RepID=A0A0G4LIM0_VERLO|nr:hypothetical protein BN1723_012511 [Verticillium longisporum]
MTWKTAHHTHPRATPTANHSCEVMDRGVSMPLSSASSVDGATIGSSVDGMSYCRISFARLTCAIVPQHVLDDRRLRRPVSSPVCPADAASAGWPSTGHDGHVARVGRTARFRPPEYCLRIPQVSQDEEVGSQADRYSEGLACRWTAGATADEPCGREGEEGEEEEGEQCEKMGRRGRKVGRRAKGGQEGGRWAGEDEEAKDSDTIRREIAA